MEIVYDEEMLEDYIGRATQASPEHPVLVDRFLDDAIEIDVDALFDGDEMYLGGIMEHIEEAGIHSGDSACVLPPVTLGATEIERVRASTEAIARGIGVRGLLNVQFALARRRPLRARGEPAGEPDRAVRLQGDRGAAREGRGADHARRDDRRPADRGDAAPSRGTARPCRTTRRCRSRRPCCRSSGSAPPRARSSTALLGPEMRSTGEVMGIDGDFPRAFAKSQSAAYGGLPDAGRVFVSVADGDKRAMVFPVKRLVDLGFEVLATEGTAQVLRRNGIPSTVVRKHSSGPGPDGEPTIVDRITAGEVAMVVNTPSGPAARLDGYEIRAATTAVDAPIITTVQQLAAAVQAIEAARDEPVHVASLQEHAAALRAARGRQG